MEYLMFFMPYYFTPYDWLLIPAIIFMLVAQFKVSSAFKKYSRVPSRAGVTGADVARILLRARGIDVPVERTQRQLGNGCVEDPCRTAEAVCMIVGTTETSVSISFTLPMRRNKSRI